MSCDFENPSAHILNECSGETLKKQRLELGCT